MLVGQIKHFDYSLCIDCPLTLLSQLLTLLDSWWQDVIVVAARAVVLRLVLGTII